MPNLHFTFSYTTGGSSKENSTKYVFLKILKQHSVLSLGGWINETSHEEVFLAHEDDYNGEFPRWIGASYLANEKQILDR